MMTAVDTNILLDVLVPNAPHGDASEQALIEAARAGAVIVSEPVYAELAAYFSARLELDGFLTATGLRLVPASHEALYQAGRAWSAYRQRRAALVECPQCGTQQEIVCSQCERNLQPRQHVVADFLIGAHALLQADRLLTRDRRYYATYFPKLRVG